MSLALEAAAYQVMYQLEKYLDVAAVEPSLKELIKLRTSPINRSAYYIQVYMKEARLHGETEDSIYALSVWQQSPLFSSVERAVFAITEEHPCFSAELSKDSFDNAIQLLGEHRTSECIMQAV